MKIEGSRNDSKRIANGRSMSPRTCSDPTPQLWRRNELALGHEEHDERSRIPDPPGRIIVKDRAYIFTASTVVGQPFSLVDIVLFSLLMMLM